MPEITAWAVSIEPPKSEQEEATKINRPTACGVPLNNRGPCDAYSTWIFVPRPHQKPTGRCRMPRGTLSYQTRGTLSYQGAIVTNLHHLGHSFTVHGTGFFELNAKLRPRIASHNSSFRSDGKSGSQRLRCRRHLGFEHTHRITSPVLAPTGTTPTD